MGEEIADDKFSPSAYEEFSSRLANETNVLKSWLSEGRLKDSRAFGGFEQEAWLLDDTFNPAPLNEVFIETANSELVSAELAKFNVELNVYPLELHGSCMRDFHDELQDNWNYCADIAKRIGTRLTMIGILPTVRDEDLVIENMSSLNRYKALNEQVMLARKGRPMHLDIIGHEHLESIHYDVMLESAATSFQIHRQVPTEIAARYINTSIAISAITVAIGTNSPYLFGKHLWEETRIPLFEQAVEVGGLGSAVQGPIRRVTFGGNYLRHDVFECFKENLDHYPVLLPVQLDNSSHSLPHLRLHNGTIWRWNRPLLGFDSSGEPHIRVEHRVVSAGPTIIDEIANAVFYYGLMEWFTGLDDPIEIIIPHSQAKNNFYEAARLGIDAHIDWLDEKKIQIGKLVLDDLLEKSRLGLQKLEVDQTDIDDYLGIIEARVSKHQCGSHWQKAFVDKNGPDMYGMLEEYYKYQNSGNAVHDWPL
jgi:hypothetical protein